VKCTVSIFITDWLPVGLSHFDWCCMRISCLYVIPTQTLHSALGSTIFYSRLLSSCIEVICRLLIIWRDYDCSRSHGIARRHDRHHCDPRHRHPRQTSINWYVGRGGRGEQVLVIGYANVTWATARFREIWLLWGSNDDLIALSVYDMLNNYLSRNNAVLFYLHKQTLQWLLQNKRFD